MQRLLHRVFGGNVIIAIISALLSQAVETWLSETLTPREIKVLRLFYGLNGDPMTTSEVSRVFDVNNERITQITEKALRKLKRSVREQKPQALFVATMAGITLPEKAVPSQTLEQPSDDESIDCLGLTVRSSNGLKSEGVFIIGQLVACSEVDLFKIPGFGKKSLIEVKDALTAHGLSLKTNNS